MNNSYRTYTIIAALIIILGGGVWWERKDPPQTPRSISEIATSSDFVLKPPEAAQEKPKPMPQPAPSAYSFPIFPGETVVSWDFAGPYKDGGVLEAKARAVIEKSKGLIDSGTFTNYILYVSIANQYNLLGDGKQEFDYLNKALAIDSTITGLAWHNMGKLLERLGAYKSARIAYDAMIQAQSTSQYILARLEFLKAHMSEDADAITQAEAALAVSSD